MIFLIVFLTLYGTLNVYAWLTLCRAMPEPWLWRVLAGIVIAGMFALPLGLAFSRRMPTPVMLLMFAWMIWVFWFDSIAFTCHAWNLAEGVIGAVRGRPAAAWPRLSPGMIVALGVAGVVLGSLLGSIEARRVRMREIRLTCPRLPEGVDTLRIAQITDLHAGYSLSDTAFDRMMGILETSSPDIIVSTGDLVDPPSRRLSAWMDRLARLKPPLGKYAVFGNHEFYVHPEMADRLTGQAGFHVLRNDIAFPVPWLRLVGIDDPAGWRSGRAARPSEPALLARDAEKAPLTILLKHQPQVDDAARELVDLQLSGHTHRGQVFPFGLFVRMQYPHAHGRLIAFGDRLRLYVSPGTGTWGAPLRLLARPEVTVFVLARP